METISKPPAHCSEEEIKLFHSMALEGGEVTVDKLIDRIKAAHLLTFIYEGTVCVAIGALKNPVSSYRKKVFRNAGSEKLEQEFTYELGYIYIKNESHGKGLGKQLTEAICNALSGATAFATTRSNNHAMIHLLEQYGFRKIGKPYQGSGAYDLILFGK